MTSRNVHTPPIPSGKGWANQVGGNIVGRHRAQEKAAERGSEIARENHSEHANHRKDGNTGTKNSNGNAPYPPTDQSR